MPNKLMMNDRPVNGIILSCGWPPPAGASAKAFMATAGLTLVNSLSPVDAGAQTLSMGLAWLPISELQAGA